MVPVHRNVLLLLPSRFSQFQNQSVWGVRNLLAPCVHWARMQVCCRPERAFYSVFSVCPSHVRFLGTVSFSTWLLPCVQKRQRVGIFLDNYSAALLATPAAQKSRQSSDIASCNLVAVGVNAPAFWGSSHRSTYWHGRMTAGESLIKVVTGSVIEWPFTTANLLALPMLVFHWLAKWFTTTRQTSSVIAQLHCTESLYSLFSCTA